MGQVEVGEVGRRSQRASLDGPRTSFSSAVRCIQHVQCGWGDIGNRLMLFGGWRSLAAQNVVGSGRPRWLTVPNALWVTGKLTHGLGK
jgi:hypothetical protein